MAPRMPSPHPPPPSILAPAIIDATGLRGVLLVHGESLLDNVRIVNVDDMAHSAISVDYGATSAMHNVIISNVNGASVSAPLFHFKYGVRATLTNVAARVVQASDRLTAEAGNRVYALSQFALRWDSLCAAALLALICIARCTRSGVDAKSHGGGAAGRRPSRCGLSEPAETARLLVESV